MIRKRELGEKDNDSVFAVEMTSAIRIANWVVIKILINYLLLFHREEISAYLIGIAEIYSVPFLHKLNVKNESTVCPWEGEKEIEEKWVCDTGQDPQVMWIRAALVKSLDVRLRMPEEVLWFGCLLGVCAVWKEEVRLEDCSSLSSSLIKSHSIKTSHSSMKSYFQLVIPQHHPPPYHQRLAIVWFFLLIYFNFSSAHAPGTYTIMAITHCTKHINNFSMKGKGKAEIRVL